jgi:hypothetical protein
MNTGNAPAAENNSSARAGCPANAPAAASRDTQRYNIDSMPTYIGIVRDNAGPRPDLATQCPVIRPPKYTLQTDTEAWVFADEQLAARYVGKKVLVRGTVTNGNKLKVDSIAPAK